VIARRDLPERRRSSSDEVLQAWTIQTKAVGEILPPFDLMTGEGQFDGMTGAGQSDLVTGPSGETVFFLTFLIYAYDP